jgi:hypothetical protein
MRETATRTLEAIAQTQALMAQVDVAAAGPPFVAVAIGLVIAADVDRLLNRRCAAD